MALRTIHTRKADPGKDFSSAEIDEIRESLRKAIASAKSQAKAKAKASAKTANNLPLLANVHSLVHDHRNSGMTHKSFSSQCNRTSGFFVKSPGRFQACEVLGLETFVLLVKTETKLFPEKWNEMWREVRKVAMS